MAGGIGVSGKQEIPFILVNDIKKHMVMVCCMITLLPMSLRSIILLWQKIKTLGNVSNFASPP